MRHPTDPHGGASKKALEAQTDESPDLLRSERHRRALKRACPPPWGPYYTYFLLTKWEIGLAVVLAIIATSLFWMWMKL